MTQKKTMTKNEAWEFLKDKYVPVYSLEDAFKVLKIFENIGFEIDQFADSDVDDEFPWHVLPDDEDEVGICWSGYRVHAMDKETFELYLSDLLAIEIVEEPAHQALLEEAVKLLEKMLKIRDLWAAPEEMPKENQIEWLALGGMEAEIKSFIEANKTIPKSK